MRAGLQCWLREQVVSIDGSEKVRALRCVKANQLPEKLSCQFRTNWQPIFRFLDPVLGKVQRDVVVTDEALERVYGDCMAFLKERVWILCMEGANESKGV